MNRALSSRLVHLKRRLGRVAWVLRPSRLPAMGKGCRIHPNAEFGGRIDGITLGDDVRVAASAELVCGNRGRIEIGSRTAIGAALLNTGTEGYITLGSDCSINAHCALYGNGGIRIGKFVRIAANCVIVAETHLFDEFDRPIDQQPKTGNGIEIGDDVWIAAGVVILDGVRIGDGAVVGAGSVVTRNVPANAVAIGVPARVIRLRGRTAGEAV